MTEQTPELSGMLKKSKGMLIFLGILCIILGMASITAPLFAGAMVTIFVGIMLLAAGLSEVIHSFHTEGSKTLAFLKGLLSLAAGGVILARPLFGLAVLTMMLAVYFILDGIMWCIMAFNNKGNQGWGMALFNGIITFLLGFMIWRHWPISGVWAIGVLVGIRILMAGWTMLFFSSVAGTLAKEAAELEA